MAKRTFEDRFWSKVDRSGGPDACWPWTGHVRPNGYGLAPYERTSMQANRLAWVLTNGPISRSLQVDHQCHNRDLDCAGGPTCRHRRCCNPAHLDAVSRLVNVRRAARRASQPRERCIAGHDLTGDNRYVNPRGRVKCMECARAFRRAYNWKVRGCPGVPKGASE